MYLARDKYGNIGRQIPGASFGAEIAQPYAAESPGNVEISSAAQIDYQQKLRRQKYLAHKADRDQKRYAELARVNQAQALSGAQARNIAQFQGPKNYDPVNEKLKAYFARKMQMGSSSSDQVALSVSATSGAVFKPVAPADFSQSGANMHLVPDDHPQETVVWESDFRTHMIKGNPLTRDGKFGPAVTDYDRFVQGTDVNDQSMGRMRVSGNTIYGRREGSGRATTLDRALRGLSGMGQDPSFDATGMYSDPGIVDTSGSIDVSTPPVTGDVPVTYDTGATAGPSSALATGIDTPVTYDTGVTFGPATAGAQTDSNGNTFWSAAGVAASQALPAALKAEMLQAIGQGKSVSTKGSVMTIGPSTSASLLPANIPAWAMYGAMGLFGLVVLKILTKK